MKITAVHLNLFNSIELKVGRFSSNDLDRGRQDPAGAQQIRAEKEQLIDLAAQGGVWVDINRAYDRQTEGLQKPAPAQKALASSFVYDASGVMRNKAAEKGGQINIFM